MNWIWIAVIAYLAILLFTCLVIIFETQNSSKTLAYLLFCTFVPVIGMFFYYAFGVNYWKIKKYAGKQAEDEKLLKQIQKISPHYQQATVAKEDVFLKQHAELANMLIKDIKSPVTSNNSVKLLLNGEEKFPELIDVLSKAMHHIHMEYYIYEQDEIGERIIDLLIKKATEGVEVRFIYDDFGSPSIKKKTEKKMQDAGIEIHPFSKIQFYLLANRINYRNHRKIVVIDGQTAFVGGINVSDKYINNKKQELFWRDTHIRIDGPGIYYLQFLFLSDWKFCCGTLKLKPEYFSNDFKIKEDTCVQIVGSGPDSTQPSVLFAVLQAIYLAQKEILITTPYFIPGDNIMDALRIAASSGLTVKLLVPGKGDSKIVNAASKANYAPLLQAGVEIYFYEKGFVHAKTMVTDGALSVIGTANMDYRSFELNFEVNAMVYDAAFAEKMRQVFFEDLKDAKQMTLKKWEQRHIIYKLSERIARLFSPAL